MLTKEFVKLCVDSTNKAIKEIGLPLNKVLAETDRLFQDELKNNGFFTDNLTKPEIFDLYSYATFKVVSKYLKENEKRLKFTQSIGKKIYSWIKNQKNLRVNGSKEIYKINRILKQVIQFFEDMGYVSSARIDWTFFNENVWIKKGESYFVYVMENPVILPSAKRLFQEEGFGQHYSTRVLEAALLDFGISGKEVESFDPLPFDTHVEELWMLKIIK